jgi:hypothetical protein
MADWGQNYDADLTGSKDFISSNSAIAKIAFVLLIVIVFFILVRLGTVLMAKLYAPSGSPYLIKGAKDAKKQSIISQNPNNSGAIPVIRSRNQSEGLEFTYSVWIYVDDLQYLRGQYRHIFHKGNDTVSFKKPSYGLNFPNNAPGLYIHPDRNALVVIMNTFKTINEEIIVDDIPLNKWINVVIRVEGRNIDIYINGNMALRHVLSSVPKQNYGDVYVNMNGGYSGLLSNLRYYNYALSTMDIYNLAESGPNLSMDKSTMVYPPYFSLRWYFQNAN